MDKMIVHIELHFICMNILTAHSASSWMISPCMLTSAAHILKNFVHFVRQVDGNSLGEDFEHP